MESPVRVPSDGLELSGILHIPDGLKPGEKIPAFLVLHGFMGSKDELHAEIQAKMLCDWGYAALRFDMRGCGDTGGERGYVRCLDQVADTRNCLTWLAERPEIDPKRIGVIGHSFGAAVAIYSGGVDERFAAVISSCGWGHGERKFHGQHPGPEAWDKFTKMLVRGASTRSAPASRCGSRAGTWCRSRNTCASNLPTKAQMQCRSKPRRACSTSAPRRWSARSHRAR